MAPTSLLSFSDFCYLFLSHLVEFFHNCQQHRSSQTSLSSYMFKLGTHTDSEHVYTLWYFCFSFPTIRMSPPQAWTQRLGGSCGTALTKLSSQDVLLSSPHTGQRHLLKYTITTFWSTNKTDVKIKGQL